MTHIMLDLETWGTAPGSDIRSIGACVFKPDTGFVSVVDHTFYIATDNPMGYWSDGEFIETGKSHQWCKYPLTRDPRTVQWWSEQSDEANAAFANPCDLREALLQFAMWLNCEPGRTHSLRLWSHGSHFDPPILAAAYQAVGLPVPWHYRAPRDTRTIFDAAGIDDHSAWLAQHPGPLGIAHHALDDAICQARAVCAAMARIGSVSDAQFDEIGSAMVNLSALMNRAGFLDNDHNHAAYERVVRLWQNAIGHPDGKELVI